VLTKEDNELLTRSDADTPLGQMFRRYWLPALLSEEIPEPDCPPVRVKIMGEDLVAFRDSHGKVGLIAELCAHRRASLFYGRNEDDGLRCVYHGWKYDVDGRVLETPAEPEGSTLKDKAHHPAYPCIEASGVVFTYMGPPEKQPEFPAYEWLTIEPANIGVTKFILESNYLQALEGDCDTSHTAFLHRGNSGEGIEKPTENAPTFEIERTWCGLRAAALRPVDGDQVNVRVSTFAMPFIGNVPVGTWVNGKLDGYLVVYQVPMDDYTTARYNFRFKRSEPLIDNDIIKMDRMQVGPDYHLIANPRNGWLMDRNVQKTTNYTGVQGFATQDAFVTDSMGRISDRSQELLGVSDSYVVALRLTLLKAVKDFKKGIEPPGLVFDPLKNDYSAAACTAVTVPVGTPWRQVEEAVYA